MLFFLLPKTFVTRTMFPQCLRRLSWVLGAGARDVLLQFRHSGTYQLRKAKDQREEYDPPAAFDDDVPSLGPE